MPGILNILSIHSLSTFILLTYSIPIIRMNMYMQAEWKAVWIQFWIYSVFKK